MSGHLRRAFAAVTAEKGPWSLREHHRAIDILALFSWLLFPAALAALVWAIATR